MALSREAADPRPFHGASVRLGLLLLLFTAGFVVFFQRSTSGWWFEDDPLQFAFAASLPQPAAVFVSPSVLRGFGTGASLVPMQVLSYWIDVRLFGASPKAAHVHSLVSTVATALLLYLVLGRFTGEWTVSAGVAVLWLLLPATMGVTAYLGTRHYLEGLAWSLAACLALHRLARREAPGQAKARGVLLVLACAVAAMLSKELYAATLPPLLALCAWSWGRRLRLVAYASLALWPAYAAYRAFILGANPTYPVPSLSVRDYLRYLSILPYTFAAGPAGYLCWAILLLLLLLLLLLRALRVARRPEAAAGSAALLFLGITAAGLAASYPTAAAVLMSYRTPGTWYRAVFLLHTTVLLAAGYLLARHARRWVRLPTLVLIGALLLPGALATRAYWQRRFADAENEGRFYLSNPDRLIYDEEDASWFLPGLDRLYGVARPHAVSKLLLADARVKAELSAFGTIWRYRDGRWMADDALYAALREKNDL